VFLGANLEQTQIREGTGLPAAYKNFVNDFGYTSSGAPLTLGWARDGRDSALVPTRGNLQRLNADVSLVGDLHYYRASYQFQQYFALTKKYTLALNTDLGWGQGIGGREFPLFKNFYVGGQGSVRGFQQSSVGPPTTTTGVYLGGPKKMVFNAEFLSPFPGTGTDKTLRVFTFMDAGRAFAGNEKLDFNELRVSAGFGLSWISPMGPLRLSYAIPLRSQSGDRIEKIQFQIGTSF
jgi:outer membrane protein insertion porin family